MSKKVFITIVTVLGTALSSPIVAQQPFDPAPVTPPSSPVLQSVVTEPTSKTSSPNFILYGAIDQKEAETLVRELEVFRSAVLDIFDGPRGIEDQKIKIFYVKDLELFNELAPFEGTAAFYWTTVLGPQILINGAELQHDRGELKHSLFHEYLHHLTARHLGYNIPVWFNEGLAEYYATFELTTNGQYLVGQSLPTYFEALNDEGWIPLVTLLDALHEYPHLNDQHWSSTGSNRQKSYFYAQSWLITHYLKNMPDGMIKIRQFINSLDPRENSEASFKSIFGMSYMEFDDKLRDYVKTGSLPFEVIEPTRKQSDGPLSSEVMLQSKYKEEIYRLAVQAYETPTLNQRKDAIRAELTSGGRLNASVLASDGISAIMQDKLERADSRLDQAIKLDPTNADIQALSAMVDVYGMNGTPVYLLKPLRAKLRTAIASNKGDLKLQSLLLATHIPRPATKVDPEVIKILDKLMAARFEVSSPEVSLSLVPHLLELERYADIDRIVGVVEIWARQYEYRNRARRIRLETKAHRAIAK